MVLNRITHTHTDGYVLQAPAGYTRARYKGMRWCFYMNTYYQTVKYRNDGMKKKHLH